MERCCLGDIKKILADQIYTPLYSMMVKIFVIRKLTQVKILVSHQRPAEMLRLYGELCENPMVKWKDSIAKIVERVEG